MPTFEPGVVGGDARLAAGFGKPFLFEMRFFAMRLLTMFIDAALLRARRFETSLLDSVIAGAKAQQSVASGVLRMRAGGGYHRSRYNR